MALRSWLPLLAVVWIGCGRDDKSEPEPAKPAPGDEDKECVQLAKLCADKSKHVDKMLDECKLSSKKQREKGCFDKVSALYDCYQRELCGKADKVWTIGDLGVLAERHNKCVAERTAAASCPGN